MTLISKNLKFLRKENNLTQGQLAEQLGIKRSLIGAYEEGRAEPRVNNLINISALFDVSVDDLVTVEIEKHESSTQGAKTKILAISVDQKGDELVQLVPQKAAAGYLNGYADPEYISELPSISMPGLPSGTLRAFEVSGDSMLPVQPGTVIIGRYLENDAEIKQGKTYVLVTAEEGIVYKRIERHPSSSDVLILRSDNTSYSPYEVHLSNVLEIWEARLFISSQFPEEQNDMAHLTRIVLDLQQEVIRLKRNNG